MILLSTFLHTTYIIHTVCVRSLPLPLSMYIHTYIVLLKEMLNKKTSRRYRIIIYQFLPALLLWIREAKAGSSVEETICDCYHESQWRQKNCIRQWIFQNPGSKIKQTLQEQTFPNLFQGVDSFLFLLSPARKISMLMITSSLVNFQLCRFIFLKSTQPWLLNLSQNLPNGNASFILCKRMLFLIPYEKYYIKNWFTPT